jgi:hypothetical protein
MSEPKPLCQDVTVSVDPTGLIVCSPDPVPVSGQDVTLKFKLTTAGYQFPDEHAIVVAPAHRGRSFPNPSRTVTADVATLEDVDLRKRKNPIPYTVHLLDKASGKRLSVDPTIKNEGG